jgi:thiamine biosynthesis protein ThiS
MKITINGRTRKLREGVSLKACLAELKLDQRAAVVERNREVVHREKFADVLLEDGDILEVVRFVGGG